LFCRFIAVLTVGSFAVITFLSFSSFGNSSSDNSNNNAAKGPQNLEEANAASYINSSSQSADEISNYNESEVNQIINEDLSKLGVPPLNISKKQIDDEINKVEELGKNKKVTNE
jgi:hypothetical protein